LNEKAALIEAEKDEFPIAWMCRQLDIPRSTFYAWRERVDQVTATQARRQWLTRLVRAEFALQKSTAGCRRITVALNQRGVACSVGLVAAIMREEGLAAIQPRAWRRTTVTDPDAVVFDDLLERDFNPGHHTHGSALVGDITYLRTGSGLGLPRDRARSRHPDDRGLADGHPYARQPRRRRTRDGPPPRSHHWRDDISFGPWFAIYVAGIPDLLPTV